MTTAGMLSERRIRRKAKLLRWKEIISTKGFWVSMGLLVSLSVAAAYVFLPGLLPDLLSQYRDLGVFLVGTGTGILISVASKNYSDSSSYSVRLPDAIRLEIRELKLDSATISELEREVTMKTAPLQADEGTYLSRFLAKLNQKLSETRS